VLVGAFRKPSGNDRIGTLAWSLLGSPSAAGQHETKCSYQTTAVPLNAGGNQECADNGQMSEYLRDRGITSRGKMPSLQYYRGTRSYHDAEV